MASLGAVKTHFYKLIWQRWKSNTISTRTPYITNSNIEEKNKVLSKNQDSYTL